MCSVSETYVMNLHITHLINDNYLSFKTSNLNTNFNTQKKNDEKHLLYCIVTAVIVFCPKTPKTTKYNKLYSDYNALYSDYNKLYRRKTIIVK